MKSKWDQTKIDFKNFLKLERSLSPNSVDAYLSDLEKLKQFSEMINPVPELENMTHHQLTDFIIWINDLGVSARTQSRIISGIRTFYRYLLLEEIVDADPTELVESPKIGRKLPEVLTIEEIDSLLAAIDLSKAEGQRNKAMLETFYSCGLRVSELVNFRLSDMHIDSGFIKILGKGSKERLVPISPRAIKEINLYMPDRHKLLDKINKDILFLNNRGNKLSRIMVFIIIKDLAEKIGLKKIISPHTFRHSFASHLVDGGADLRAVQEMLGHESIITTEIYTHLDREYLRDAIIRFHPRS